jgi:nucleoside-diphosphate-sugar epimerase
MQTASKSALVVGITGSIGREVAAVLLSRGWQVTALHRNPSAAKAASDLSGISWIAGDAMQHEDVIQAARGCDVIVHAANPPNYHNWRGLALPMLKHSIAAAKASGARLLLPGNIYNYGENAAPLLTENSPQCPPTKKGAVRVEMEILLQKASLYGVRSIVVRAGDFFGPKAYNSWLTRGLVNAKRRIKSVAYPGPHAVGHSWAYLPDLAETMVRLIESPLPMKDFEVFNFQGHWFERGAELPEIVSRLSGLDANRIKSFPWWLINLGAPFIEAFREMREMRYLWEVPMHLDNAKLQAQIGAEPHTPIEYALRATLGSSLPSAAGTSSFSTAHAWASRG